MTIQDSAKTILCFGDSNTWGAVPDSDDRYPRSIRWPYLLQSLLGNSFEVISEGLNGRTLVAVDPEKPQRTGITHLWALLETHDPIDLVVILLGTNDVKSKYNLSAEDIADHLKQTIQLIQSDKINIEPKPQILVICPPPPVVPDSGVVDPRMTRAPEIFDRLPLLFETVVRDAGVHFINAGDYITSSKIDGYHLDPTGHEKLAEVVKAAILSMKL